MRAWSLPRPSDVSRLLRCVMSRATVRSAGSPLNVSRRLCSSAHMPCSSLLMSCTSNGVNGSLPSAPVPTCLRITARYAGRSKSVIGLPTSVSGPTPNSSPAARFAYRIVFVWISATSGNVSANASNSSPRSVVRACGSICAARRAASSLRSSKRFIDAVMSTNALRRPLTGMRSGAFTRSQQVVQILAEPFDFAHVWPPRPRPDQRADEQQHDECRQGHDRIGEELRHGRTRREQRRATAGQTAPTLDDWIPEVADRQRDPCWHVSARPHVFPRVAARTPVLVVIAHPARLVSLRGFDRHPAGVAKWLLLPRRFTIQEAAWSVAPN